MQISTVLTNLEAAISTQLALAGGDPVLEQAASQILAVLEPALRQAALELAEQAALEVGAQLGKSTVEVVITDGEPTLRVTAAPGHADEVVGEDFDARITLRLPPSLKGLVEEAATQAGDSVNTWVVKTLSGGARQTGRVGRRISGSFDL